MMLKPENSNVCRKAMEWELPLKWKRVTENEAVGKLLSQTAPIRPPLHMSSLKQRSKDGWHLVEALGSAK